LLLRLLRGWCSLERLLNETLHRRNQLGQSVRNWRRERFAVSEMLSRYGDNNCLWRYAVKFAGEMEHLSGRIHVRELSRRAIRGIFRRDLVQANLTSLTLIVSLHTSRVEENDELALPQIVGDFGGELMQAEDLDF